MLPVTFSEVPDQGHTGGNDGGCRIALFPPEFDVRDPRDCPRRLDCDSYMMLFQPHSYCQMSIVATRMVDIHSHILPNVDDGASSWEVAVRMCQMAAQDGITHMVASPHANDEFSYDRALHTSRLDELARRVGASPQLRLGCDFHFSYENLRALERDPQQFTISGTQYLLVELSDFSVPPWVTDKLKELLASGIKPIITHPERNMLLQRRPEQVVDWVNLGCVVQITANSLTDRWGQGASKTAHALLREQAVHIIASDSHNLESRPPVLSQASAVLEKTYGVEVARALAISNPLAVVENRKLPALPLIQSSARRA